MDSEQFRLFSSAAQSRTRGAFTLYVLLMDSRLKIGISADDRFRERYREHLLAARQYGDGEELRLVGALRHVRLQLEWVWHTQLRPWRVPGEKEWFYLSVDSFGMLIKLAAKEPDLRDPSNVWKPELLTRQLEEQFRRAA